MSWGSKTTSGQRQSTKTDNTGSQYIDPITQGRMGEMWAAAQGAGMSGPSPLVTGATGYNTGLMTAGNTGLNALAGNADSTKALMDPYQQQVINANNAQWQQTNANTMKQVNDAATSAGAFGGSRASVARGAALSGNNVAQQQQTAGLLSSGYQGAMDRASQLAQMGYAGAGANANLGMGGVGNPQQWLMMMLNQAYKGPMGQNTSQHTSGATAGTGMSGTYGYGHQ